MSTRGYLTIVDDDKNVVLAAYCPNSAYPSYQGIQVLDALAEGKFPHLIEEMKEDYPEERDTVKDIQRSWYVKDRDNKEDFFPDYAYEFEPGKGRMNLFHFGEKALTVDLKEIPLFKTIFEKEYSLSRPLRFDPRTMTLNRDFYAEIRKMLRDGAREEDFLALAETNSSILYMDKERFRDHTTFYIEDSFIKNVWDAGTDSRLKFIVDKMSYSRGDEYCLYVQTPFFRGQVPGKILRSPTAAEKALAEILRDRPEDVRATMELFKEIDQFKASISKDYSDKSRSLVDRDACATKRRSSFLIWAEEIYSKHNVLGIRFEQVKSNILDYALQKYRTAKDADEKTKERKPALSDQIDAAGAVRTSYSSIEKQPPDIQR